MELTEAQAAAVLSVAPSGARIVTAVFFDNYSRPCPIRVDLQWPDGGAHSVVVRLARHGAVETEARLLATLAELGFPAPRVLAEPAADPRTNRPFTVLSLVPGHTLQGLAEESANGLTLARRLLIDGVGRLAGLTDALAARPIAAELPHLDLPAQLAACVDPRRPWSGVPSFVRAARRLEPVLQAIAEPLVFSNGDYQPANFLAQDDRLSGVVDFELAAFHDPLIGFAKYPIYDMHPLNGAGVVDDFLEARGYSRRDFAPRLALGCLLTLQREIAVEGGDEHERRYREHVLGLLAQALDETEAREF